MPDPHKTIPVFELESAQAPLAGPGARPLQARGGTERAVQLVETSVDALAASMNEFLTGVNDMLAEAADKAGAFRVETVEVQCQISGSGKIGFAGTGVDLSGGSSLKLVLKRKTP
ncbi:MAG: hypothetical protein MUF66_03745 [Gammaproteobacteria bacterium]|jgi:hypothetical protein|nr:hypothetical protein [Thiobacillaceae bacterium]MCU0935192.1 hypothetical protein [Gammaproteobacteria bacterium]